MSKEALSKSQMKVYKYIVESMQGSVPPTVREICSATGLKSTSSVHSILGALENLGYISRNKGCSRAIRIEGAKESIQVPIIGRVTAGQPILAVEEIEDYIPYPANAASAEGMFALRVVGLSMRDAGILDGDIVVADATLRVESGNIVVALMEDEATVKRIGFEKNKPVLYPENPDFDPIYPADNLRILGKVVGSFRKY